MVSKYRIICGQGRPEDSQPLTAFDLLMSHTRFDVILIYGRILDDDSLAESLKKIVRLYPCFAGSIVLSERAVPVIDASRGGLLFITKYYDKFFHNYGYERSDFDEYNFCAKTASQTFDETIPLVQIKHSIFKNCSVIGISVSHQFCDAASLWSFLAVWAKLTRSEPFGDLHCDREMLHRCFKIADEYSGLAPSRRPGSSFEKMVLETGVFHLSDASLKALWVSGGENAGALSEQDVAMAYIGSLVAKGAKISDKEQFPLSLLFNVRNRLSIPKTYIGNMVFMGVLKMSKEEAADGGVIPMARLIRLTSQRLTMQELRKQIPHMLVARPKNRLSKISSLMGGVLINNWSRFPIYEIDFGGGPPLWFDFPRFEGCGPMGRSVLIVGKYGVSRGIDYYVSLPPDELSLLRKSFLSHE